MRGEPRWHEIHGLANYADDGTPRRVVGMLAELLTPEPFRPTTFPNDAGYDELVLVSEGSAARQSGTTSGQPLDAVIMGVLDSLEVDGTVTFRKS